MGTKPRTAGASGYVRWIVCGATAPHADHGGEVSTLRATTGALQTRRKTLQVAQSGLVDRGLGGHWSAVG